MSKYVFKMSKEGKDVNGAIASDLLIDSDQPFFKFHQDSTGSVIFTPGDTHQSVDFNHGLSYTPAFIAYWQDSNNAIHFIPSLPYPFGFETPGIASAYPYAYVDGTKVRCGVQIASGAYNQVSPVASDEYAQHFGATSYFSVGHHSNGDYTENGAIRFEGIAIPQGTTINEAILNIYCQFKGSGTGDLKAKIYGIDEDNTAAFGDPMGRTKTTAVDEANWSLPAVGGYSAHNVTAEVQEIISRGGWVTGNALGFIIENNGSPTDVYITDQKTGNTTLTIKYGSNQTLNFRAIIFKDKIA